MQTVVSFLRFKYGSQWAVIVLLMLHLTSKGLVAQHFWLPTDGPNGGVVSCLAVDSSGQIYAGTLHSGVYTSANRGKSWERINRGLPSREISAMSLASDGNLYASAGNGHVFWFENRGKEWTISTSLPSEVHTLFVDHNGDLFAGTGGHGVFKLDNKTTSWTQTGLKYASVQCLASGPDDEFYAATNLGLLVSNNGWSTWQTIQIPEVYVFSLAVDARGQLFAGTWGGKVYRSQDKGKTWTQVNLGSRNSIVRSLSIDENNDIFAGVSSKGVFRSKDGGANWEAINDGLTDLMVRSLAVDSDGEILVGTFSGIVFRGSESNLSFSDSWPYPIFAYLLLNPPIYGMLRIPL